MLSSNRRPEHCYRPRALSDISETDKWIGGGEGSTRPLFGYKWFENDRGQKTRRLVLKPFIGNCNIANSRQSHGFCILGVPTNFIWKNQIGRAGKTLLTDSPKLYTLSRTGSQETIFPVLEVKNNTPSSDTSPHRHKRNKKNPSPPPPGEN